MADKKFEAILILLVPQVVQLICENYPVDEMMASKEFYEPRYIPCWSRKTQSCGISARLPYLICMTREKDRKLCDSGGGMNMSRQGDFLIYCVETYKNAKHLTGKQVAELFTRYRVWDYVYSCFEALHTTGANYIVEDIDLYIEARKPAMA